ncbi:hypothetical protein F4815DRAFT_488625 [Daldinia loculata]|nr:hypothetical protein F4815DRAFT_488625 [Daldinia loculata]
MTSYEKQALWGFLWANKINRYIPWNDLRLLVPEIASHGTLVVDRTMKELGFKRKIRGRTKLPLSDDDFEYRARLCDEWLEAWPTPEAWLERGPVFSDEMFCTNQPYFRRYITIHDCEDRATFELLRTQSYHGWMFWGCFQGKTRGPCFVWPKGEGGITAEKYCNYILPLVQRFLNSLPVRTVFQHDNAPPSHG